MKRYLVIFCAVLLALLCACGREPVPTVYEKDGWTVDTEARTLTKNGDVIHYSASGSNVSFTYPDGSTSSWNQNDSMGFLGTSSPNFDHDRWPSAWDLMDVLERDDVRERKIGNPLGLLLIPLGVLQAAFPSVFWFLSDGWKYKNAEPSELALGLGRAGGVLVALVGLVMLF